MNAWMNEKIKNEWMNKYKWMHEEVYEWKKL